jgi:riboflavin kinase/FMN adenylyltransferase
MKVVHGLTHFKPLDKKPAVALGVFDGLHRGHQRIIANLLKEAKRARTTSLIVTFFPHPQKESSLYCLTHRLKLIEEFGVDVCLVIRFNEVFRNITASGFLKNVLTKKINPAIVLIGRNFTFGRYAEGNWRTLEDYSQKAGFKLRIINVLTYKGRPISSSYIRTLIKRGDLLRAQVLLGRPVSILGRVIKGQGLGRILGYPTANIIPDHEVLPLSGVYTVRIRLIKEIFNGICYIGRKPTFIKTASKTNIEVHIFNLRGDLYGRKIQIEFIKRIRSEKRFSSIYALAHQIKKDIQLSLKQVKS